MHKLLVFTDIHITAPGETIIGLDPLTRFSRCLAHALAHHPDAARIVIAGDLTHTGAAAEYARLHEALAGCPVPVAMTLGNHDRRAAFRAAFADVPVDPAGFVQSVHDLGGYRLILLDTADEDAGIVHGGRLCAARLDWLDAALDAAPATPAVLFLHHPPMATGFAGMDRIGLTNRDELIGRLSRHSQLRQIVAGHIHRTIMGSAGGVPTAILKSPCHQMPMILDDTGHSLSVDEPGAYGIVLLTDGGVIVHTEDVP